MTIRLILFSLLLTSILFAYTDNDIDGVEDKLDLCPNTSFDLLVDKNGCPENESTLQQISVGEFTFQIGHEINFDNLSNKNNRYNFFMDYTYKQWNVSISNSQQENEDNRNNTGDVYLSLGYLFKINALQNKIIIGSKIANSNNELSTAENDYFTTVHLTHTLNQKQSIFTHLNYTLTGNSPIESYKNTLGYTLGSDYAVNKKYYTALSYDYVQSIYHESEAYKAISFFNQYLISDDFYLNLNYSRSLDENSFKHSIALNLGVIF
ncbi:MAG: Unknown protein [uncultured Sulfurovum sp.]|uniref:Uncharacterized protein n=1 Tax=uncultured Sulfurovum sp. TaxID=269237 RepID=A0A6S6SCB4_9BACT|nr:MAG: Unknown protein [uncultured Sulfurovum sp.]